MRPFSSRQQNPCHWKQMNGKWVGWKLTRRKKFSAEKEARKCQERIKSAWHVSFLCQAQNISFNNSLNEWKKIRVQNAVSAAYVGIYVCLQFTSSLSLCFPFALLCWLCFLFFPRTRYTFFLLWEKNCLCCIAFWVASLAHFKRYACKKRIKFHERQKNVFLSFRAATSLALEWML